MIKKIDSIRNFGIYKNFSWTSPSGIKDFNYKNLFYGWNYSGKTTLSRIFSSLRDKKIHDSYTNGTFKVSTDNNGIYDSSNLESFPYDILVFNSDYIQDNLNFSIHVNNSSDSKTILFEVGNNAKYETKIIELQGKVDSIKGTDVILGKKIKFQSDIDEFEIYDKGYTGKFTLISKEIQDEHFLSLIRFTKTNLKPIISKIKDDLNNFIVSDKKELSYLNDIVKVSEPKDELNEIIIDFNYSSIVEEVNKVLDNTPEKKVLNKILDTNNDAYNWVKKGKDLHTPNSKCLFCDNIVSEERLNYLIEYFNSQASTLKEEVDRLKTLVYDEINKIDAINYPSSNDLNLGFINEYIEIRNKLDKNLAKYKKHLNTILSKLDAKVNKNLYTKIDHIIGFNVALNVSLIERLNILIQTNNEFSINFSSKINVERNKLIDHLVASFLKREKYLAKEKKYEKALSEIEKLDKQVQDLEKEIKSYQALKESDKEGAEQYTYFIQSFLNRDDIEIKLDEVTKKFILLRDNQNASNLSEGEKTAIAFSHFLVSIKALESKNKFKDYIVFIDDPISSLDGNHIFQINSLLKEMLFSNKNPGGQWEIRCKQLFFSSHNFEFFNLLKELPLNKKESRYFIERNRASNISEIKVLPEIFDKYSSEYHYLFKEINDFNRLRKPLDSDKLLVIPNILRRFLEMYTLTKFPSSENVDRRADKIFTPEVSKRICKPFHFFSHLDNIDRIGKQSEYMADIPIACKELVNHIKKKDKLHYEALNNAVTN
ncbi:AAA family ATPase [Elizabethkingia anophelis]|nr:AAA family ATPase [Elizabethkingia anophelis]MCT3813536.1 AAA family ATPase [Elizabethkingia anophelis]MCT3820630.1 AAA family ATPase [Elizabethkingia anophelis]MCT3942763.1 AAA family ATPase [Elizabethkingia anophelis]MCT4195521.1 AAA family ATPase [Elizabethkingia anophelis]